MDPRYAVADPAKFWGRVTPTEGCWLWAGSVNPVSGYGQFGIRANGRAVTLHAHRWGYELLVGAVPDGLVLDHLCRVRQCVNPAHLEPVTPAENTRRGLGPRRARERAAEQTHCRQGHPFSGDNLRTTTSGPYTVRKCRKCQVASVVRLRQRQRAAA